MRKCDSILTTTTFIITASLSLTLMSGYGSNQQNTPVTTVASTTLPAITDDNNSISKK
ncbi:hypothetical protein [Clostridium cellulovorans]|uniref:Uncharacterized protein n=1 Tax=Clostridium cellulovorans (strain ATCC 35296 / DSM 3052 / OCM 3 / 743B) TaxID=573061 RepID=D9SMB2_CLOC7|nr:hypothetical protein [Clostridium cellulovorans]ADL53768.1 hypothetical protein Clocel_4106 [Clostridium cellulovorans 743B]